MILSYVRHPIVINSLRSILMVNTVCLLKLNPISSNAASVSVHQLCYCDCHDVSNCNNKTAPKLLKIIIRCLFDVCFTSYRIASIVRVTTVFY